MQHDRDAAAGGSQESSPIRWSLPALATGDARILDALKVEAMELARALAARAVALARDATAAEYGDRVQTLSRTIWPADPLEGFGLQSSLGTFLIARVAMTWAPPTETKLRDSALQPPELRAAMEAAGLAAPLAATLVKGWPGVDPDFEPARSGLGAAQLAGLAEQTLSRREHDAALSQAAFSPRCTARLATTVQALDGVRRVLPVLPGGDDDDFGPEYVTAMAALALGRPDRALFLLGKDVGSPALLAIAELARAEIDLSRGRAADLLDDPTIPTPPVETSPPRASARDTDDGGDDDDDGEDAVLEIVEQVVTTIPQPASREARASSLPRPARWKRSGWDDVELDDTFVKLWRDGRAARRSIFGHVGSLLGLRPTARMAVLPPTPVPPDVRTLRQILDDRAEPTDADTAATERVDVRVFIRHQQEKLGLASAEPLFPGVRAALRSIAGAAEGHAPSQKAIDEAGDLRWVLQRARALAQIVRGDLDGANKTLAALDEIADNESRWALTRSLRFEGRKAEPVPPEAARPIAAQLVRDMSLQLGRTASGAIL